MHLRLLISLAKSSMFADEHQHPHLLLLRRGENEKEKMRFA